MAFQTKDFASIVASLINHARSVTDKITDFAPGSVVRTIMEAPAVEMEELYLQFFIGLQEAIPVATFLSFGFGILPAKRAFGYVSISSVSPLTQAITIPVGTQFLTDAGVSYTSTDALVWASGSSLVRVPVQCTVTGSVGNAASGVINSSPAFPASSGYTVSNSLIANGADTETDSERQARFAEYIASLSRGTEQACLYGAGQAVVLDIDGNIDQYVTRTGYSEVPGRVSIWIYSNRGVASSALLANAQTLMDGYRTSDNKIVPGYRAAGVRVDILAMSVRAVPLTIHVGMLNGYTLTSAVQQELTDLYSTAISNIGNGETLLLEDLVTVLLTASNVETVVPDSNSNIVCGQNEALTAGTLTITAL